MFFFLWPLFARAPRHWFLENFLLSAPGVQSVFFFLLRSVGRRDLAAGPEQKKSTTQGVFFLLRPRGKAREGEAPLEAGTGPEQKKQTPPRVFFFLLRPLRKAREGEAPLEAGTGPEQKKNTLGGVFFFAAAPRGRSLTHCGPGWRCLPLAGAVFFFLLRPHPDRGGVFFLLWPRPDAHSLTVGWGDFGKARVVFFFCCGPAGSF